ncbi:MAG: cysteine desulfurase [Candidatus Marinimicrobia bacterium]|nr:cysteine desulfurase [Candidatus Neomarinimicrobiota bacterium]
MKQANSIYLDHAAGTFLLPIVQDYIASQVYKKTGNPSSIHGVGRLASASLDKSRQEVASSIGCMSGEIIFTSGGTEANNLALGGIAKGLKKQGRHIITCRTEHPSVLESCKQLESEGFSVTYLNTNSFGRIDLNELRASITDDTILISLMWVNNETGLIHPVKDIADLARIRNVKFHCDAAQVLGHLPIQIKNLGVDAMTFSSHKIGAPSGLGVLYLRKGTVLSRQLHGGAQEGNLRAGTQNLIGATAFAKAIRYQVDHIQEHHGHYRTLMDQLQNQLSNIPGIQINRDTGEYSPHIVNCSFQNIDGEALFIRLDMKNISVSNGAACSSGSQKPSHVLTAMGLDEKLSQASLRISLGLETSEDEIDKFCHELEYIVHSLQRGNP